MALGGALGLKAPKRERLLTHAARPWRQQDLSHRRRLARTNSERRRRDPQGHRAENHGDEGSLQSRIGLGHAGYSAPRSRRLVTPCAVTPQGDDAGEVGARSGSTFRLMPWKLTQRRSLTPMAAILSSRDASGARRSTQTPTLPSRTSPVTPRVARAQVDDPGLQRLDEGPHVAAARREVEHHIGHPLSWAVIGELAAAPAAEHREPSWIEQVGRLGGHAGGVERRMLQQPDHLAGLPIGDRPSARLHERLGVRVGHEPARPRPADGGGVRAQQRGASCGLA